MTGSPGVAHRAPRGLSRSPLVPKRDGTRACVVPLGVSLPPVSVNYRPAVHVGPPA